MKLLGSCGSKEVGYHISLSSSSNIRGAMSIMY